MNFEVQVHGCLVMVFDVQLPLPSMGANLTGGRSMMAACGLDPLEGCGLKMKWLLQTRVFALGLWDRLDMFSFD